MPARLAGLELLFGRLGCHDKLSLVKFGAYHANHQYP